MSSIKEFFEAEIHENAANNGNPIPNSAQAGTAADPDFGTYFRLMDEQIESLAKAVRRG